MRAVGDRITALEQELAAVEGTFKQRMLEVPNLPDPSVPTGPGRWRQYRAANRRRAARARLRAAPALGDRPRARHSRLRSRREDLRLALLRPARRRRRPAARADRLHARPAHPRARLHRDLPALPGQDASVSTAPASFQNSRTTSTTTPRTTCAWSAPRRSRSPTCTATRSCRRTCRSTTSPTPPASGARRCPPDATCAASSAATSSTRSSSTSSSSRRVARRAGADRRRCRGGRPRPRHSLPHHLHLHRRPRLRRRQELRHRAVGARLRRVARGQLLQQLHRLPGAARQHPLPPDAADASPSLSHAQRLRAGAAAGDDRGAGELPAGGRQRRRPRGAAALPGRTRTDRARRVSLTSRFAPPTAPVRRGNAGRP